jgi:hypothetical protein
MSKTKFIFEGTVREIKTQMTEVMQAMHDVKPSTPSASPIQSDQEPATQAFSDAAMTRFYQRYASDPAYRRGKLGGSHTPPPENKKVFNFFQLPILHPHHADRSRSLPPGLVEIARLNLKTMAERAVQAGEDVSVDSIVSAAAEDIARLSATWDSTPFDDRCAKRFAEMVNSKPQYPNA